MDTEKLLLYGGIAVGAYFLFLRPNALSGGSLTGGSGGGTPLVTGSDGSGGSLSDLGDATKGLGNSDDVPIATGGGDGTGTHQKKSHKNNTSTDTHKKTSTGSGGGTGNGSKGSTDTASNGQIIVNGGTTIVKSHTNPVLSAADAAAAKATYASNLAASGAIVRDHRAANNPAPIVRDHRAANAAASSGITRSVLQPSAAIGPVAGRATAGVSNVSKITGATTANGITIATKPAMTVAERAMTHSVRGRAT